MDFNTYGTSGAPECQTTEERIASLEKTELEHEEILSVLEHLAARGDLHDQVGAVFAKYYTRSKHNQKRLEGYYKQLEGAE